MHKRILRFLAGYDDPKSLGFRFRKRRIIPLIDLIESFSLKEGGVTILDLGGTERYWDIVGVDWLKSRNVHIVLVNLPGTSSNPIHEDVFTSVEGDALDFETDLSFSIVHSNSVIEHVGDWGRMVSFSKQVKKLSSCYFVQTPSYRFPVEPHCMTLFFHWLPKPIRVWLVEKFNLGHWKKASSTEEAVDIVESARLLDRRMFQALFGDAQITTERFMGFPKSYIATRGFPVNRPTCRA
jgi:hypothetical protein